MTTIQKILLQCQQKARGGKIKEQKVLRTPIIKSRKNAKETHTLR